MKRVKPLDPYQRLRVFVRRFPSQRQAAKALGISAPYLTDLLYQRRGFSERMLHALGLAMVVAEAEKRS